MNAKSLLRESATALAKFHLASDRYEIGVAAAGMCTVQARRARLHMRSESNVVFHRLRSEELSKDGGCLRLDGFRTLPIQPNPHQQQQREQHSHEQSLLEISAAGIGHESYEGRSAGAAEITGQCEECEHRSAAATDGSGCGAERARPHDADGQSTDCAADETEQRGRRQADEQVRSDTQDRGQAHKPFEVDAVAVFAVE